MSALASVALALASCAPAALPPSATVAARAPQDVERDSSPRNFWRRVERGTVPAGKTAAEWARELCPWLASTDPELRDDLAYTVLAGWIARGALDDDALRELAAIWRADLARPGARDEDVVARSFAALLLASVVRRENRAPFLGDELARVRAAALEYAAKEADVRGYVAPLGWVHATAHAADLLAALARGAALGTGDTARLLSIVDAKAALPGATWLAGEDLRLARVAAALAAREDFDVAVFTAWVARFETDWKGLWTTTPFDAARLAALGNRRRVLAELYALLAGDATDERVVVARERVLAALNATG